MLLDLVVTFLNCKYIHSYIVFSCTSNNDSHSHCACLYVVLHVKVGSDTVQ